MNDHQLAQTIWDYMRFEQPLEKADLILGLGSTDIRTAEWCAKLQQDGWAPKILFTGGRGRLARDLLDENECDFYARSAQGLGVPADATIREARAKNTGENIAFSAQLLKDTNINVHKLILVTKPYMLRRSYATLMKQWPGARPKVICSAIDQSFDVYCHDKNYPFDHVVNVMVGDLQRIKEYPKIGFQIEQNIPNEVWSAYQELVKRGYQKHVI